MNKPAEPGTGIRVSKERLLPLWVTGGFMGLGLLAFGVIPVVLWFARDSLARGIFVHPAVVLLAHLYALGLGASVAMGAWPQLLVVAFQAETAAPRKWSSAALPLYVAGLAFLAGGMAASAFAVVAVGGSLLLAAILLNLLGTAGGARKAGRSSVMTPFVAPALLSLLLTAAVGIALATNRVTHWLGPEWLRVFGSHLYLGPVGWFGLLIPGVSYELAPFFGLTRTGNDPGKGRFHGYVAALLAAGFAGGWFAVLVGRFHPLLFAPLAAGYILFVLDLRGIFGWRPPERRTPTLAGVRAAHAYLAGLAVWLLAIGFAGGAALRAWTLFGWLAAAGWLANSVMAYLHRILPFLLWHHRYWGKPKEEVRTSFPRMVDKDRARLGFWLYNAGVVAVAAGILLRSGALLLPANILFAAGSWLLLANLVAAYFR